MTWKQGIIQINRLWVQTFLWKNTKHYDIYLLFQLFHRMWDQLKRHSSYQVLPSLEPSRKPPPDVYRELLHRSVFKSIRIVYHEDPITTVQYSTNGTNSTSFRSKSIWQSQTIVTMNSNLPTTPYTMQQFLKFIYTGSIDEDCLDKSVSKDY